MEYIVDTFYKTNFKLTNDSVLKDIDIVGEICKQRYKTELKTIADTLYIFREEMTKLLQAWNTWRPLNRVKLFKSPYGENDFEYINMYYDPNFFDECILSGMGIDGFVVAIQHPFDGETLIKINYLYVKNEFTYKLTEKNKNLTFEDC